MIHQRTHPTLDVEDCYTCKISTVTFGAVPDGTRPASIGKKNYQQLKRDVEAYEGARKAGLRPDSSTKAGVEKLERRLESEERGLKKLGYAKKSDFEKDMQKVKLANGTS